MASIKKVFFFFCFYVYLNKIVYSKDDKTPDINDLNENLKIHDFTVDGTDKELAVKPLQMIKIKCAYIQDDKFKDEIDYKDKQYCFSNVISEKELKPIDDVLPGAILGNEWFSNMKSFTASIMIPPHVLKDVKFTCNCYFAKDKSKVKKTLTVKVTKGGEGKKFSGCNFSGVKKIEEIYPNMKKADDGNKQVCSLYELKGKVQIGLVCPAGFHVFPKDCGTTRFLNYADGVDDFKSNLVLGETQELSALSLKDFNFEGYTGRSRLFTIITSNKATDKVTIMCTCTKRDSNENYRMNLYFNMTKDDVKDMLKKKEKIRNLSSDFATIVSLPIISVIFLFYTFFLAII